MLNIKSLLTKILGALYDTGWIQLATNVHYRKIGSVCYVRIGSVSASTTSKAVGTLPVNVRPSFSVYPFVARSGNTTCTGWINASGQIMVAAPSSVSSYEATFSFPVG